MSELATMPLSRRLLGPYLAWAFRVALGVIFIVAALPKIMRPDLFAWSIAYYRMVPDNMINLMAIALPWIELVCGVALIVGVAIRPNLLVIAAMLAIFIVAISLAISRDLDISCGCFSTGSEKAASMTRWTLYWDIIWLAMSVHALVFDRGWLSLDGVIKKRRAASA